MFLTTQLRKTPLLPACILAYIFIFTVPQTIANTNYNFHQHDGLHVPCTFFDTVNVTGDTKFTNGSYLHDGVLIPQHLVGLYDYVYKDLEHRIEVTPHWRGCICKVKPCINFCCPWGTVYNSNDSVCVNSTDEIKWPEPILAITLADNSLRNVSIFEQFAVKSFRPCDSMYSLLPEEFYYDEWKLFENGTMLRVEDTVYFSRNEYCLVPTTPNNTDTYIINPANCQLESDFTAMTVINAYAMLFSIPFMVLTIVVYLTIPELRNQHGKSLVCYLLGLTIGYSLLSSNALLDNLERNVTTCRTIAYISYYFFMAAFFWLSVISFDLWHNFRGTRGINRFKEKKRYIIYSLYSWGLALIFLAFTMYAQEYANIPPEYKPGIGNGLCWLQMNSWSAMIYFFGPILLIIVANMIMFVMTAMKIHKVQREMARIMAREDSTRNLRSEKDKFGLFLRLFIVMGVTWSMEIISYFVGNDKSWSKIFYVPDICNAIQGFLIFMLFVMKKKVKHLITNRLMKRQTGTSNTNSTNSTNSDYSKNPDKYAMKMTSSNAVKNVPKF